MVIAGVGITLIGKPAENFCHKSLAIFLKEIYSNTVMQGCVTEHFTHTEEKQNARSNHKNGRSIRRAS
jgi:hypothetical protein